MNRLCLMVEHGDGNTFDTGIERYVKELVKHNTKVILLCSNRPILGREIKKYERIGCEVQFFDNLGLDFGKRYSRLVENNFNIREWDEILLTNNSIDIVRPVDEIFKRIDETSGDVLGACEAYTGHNMLKETKGKHIQSWFVLYRKPTHEDMINYFKKNGVYPGKYDVIVYYELGLYKYMYQKGYTAKAYLDVDKFLERFGIHKYKNQLGIDRNSLEKDEEMNPSFMYPDLCLDYGLPFIKRRLGDKGFEQSDEYLKQKLSEMIYNLTKDKG